MLKEDVQRKLWLLKDNLANDRCQITTAIDCLNKAQLKLEFHKLQLDELNILFKEYTEQKEEK